MPILIEPFFVAQSAEPMTKGQAMHWIMEQSIEAKDKGAVLARASHHPQLDLYLFEAWNCMVTNQGEPRWQLTKEKP